MSDVNNQFNDVSSRYREVWNETAKEVGYTIQWVADEGEKGKIDTYQDLGLDINKRSVRNQHGLSKSILFADAATLQNQIAKVNKALEAKRQTALQASLNVRKVVSTTPDMSVLTVAEKEFIKRLLPSFPIFKKLEVLLKDPRGQQFQKSVATQGDQASVEQFKRTATNVCSYALEESLAKYCSPVATFPNALPVMDGLELNSLVPMDLTPEDVEVMSKATDDPMYNPYMSALTAVRRDSSEKTGWAWTKITQDPRYKSLVDELVPVLKHAANTPDLDVSLKAEIDAVVESMESDDPFSYYKWQELWAKQGTGNLEVIVGFEGGYSTMSKATAAGAFISVVRPGEADLLKEHMIPLMGELEQDMASDIGPAYTARTNLKTDTVVRVVDVVASTAANPWVTLAFVGPDAGPAAQSGTVKRVILANHNTAKAQEILLPIAQQVLVQEQVNLVTEENFVMNGAAHEMYHPVGPRADAKLEDGTRIRDAVGGGVFDSLEEAKADAGGLTALAKLAEKGQAPGIDAQYVKQATTTLVAGLIRQMRFGSKAHGGGAWTQLGYLFEHGAVTLESVTVDGQEQQRLRVHHEKMIPTFKKFRADIGRIQATGDAKAAAEFFEVYPQKVPDAVEAIIGRVNSAGIPVDVVMDYPDLSQL